MLSWASSQFEKLSQTVAPPPTDAASRFYYCCQRGEENEAMQLAGQLPGSGVVVNPGKGQVPLHASCNFGLMQLTRQLLHQPGASLEMVDGAGNSVLHCAAMCSQPGVGLDLVKMLVNEMGANVCVKNYQGQTPYDVATLNNIRQYLLPIQLQQETKEALANGGTGLPPGIDMGGLKIQNSAMPPPPMPGGGGGPMGAPPPPQVGPPPQGMMPPTQQGMPASPYPNPFASHSAPTSSSGGQGTPGAATAGAAASPYPQPAYLGGMTAPASQPLQSPQPMPAPPNNNSQPAPPAPPAAAASTETAPAPASASSDSYALSGYSSAAIRKAAPGSGGIRPDGFHSSSSDKRLAQKYGHAQTDYSHIPPPPSSGSSAGALSGAGMSAYGNPSSAPPSGGGPNPYAGGFANRQRPNRYVTYTPGQTPAAAPVVPRPFSSYGAPIASAPSPGQFNTFVPGGGSGGVATTTAHQIAPAPASAGMAALSPMPPPPFTAAAPAAPTYQQPPLQQQQTSPYALPSQQQQQQQQQTPTATTPYGQPPAAAAMFATPSPAVQQATSASSRFASPPVATSQPTTPQSAVSASSRFASPPQPVSTAFASPAKDAASAVSPAKSEQATSPFASTTAAQASPAGMFASPPKADAGAAATTTAPVPAQVPFANRDISGVSSMSSASDLFAKPAGGATASDAFASPPANVTTTPPKPVSAAQAFGQPHSSGSPAKAEPTPVERSVTPQNNAVETAEEEDFDTMDDIPLSPAPAGGTGKIGTEAQPAPAAGGNVQPSMSSTMAPPPFSST